MFDYAAFATSFSSANGGPFHAASANYAGDPLTDAGGSITSPGTPTSFPCECQVDVVTLAMRADADFQERDVRLLIIGLDALTTDASIVISAGPYIGFYELKSVARDPAAFGWECRGRAVAA